MAEKFDSIQALIESITPDVYENLRTSIETGRWPNGDKLTPEQVEHSMQAVIGWELKNLPAERRTGFIDTTGLQKSHCDTEQNSLTWIDNGNHRTH